MSRAECEGEGAASFGERTAWAVGAAAAAVLAALAGTAPAFLAHRFGYVTAIAPDAFAGATLRVARALVGPFLGLALLAGSRALWPRPSVRAAGWWATAAAVTAYLGLASALLDWQVDDAAITFAYAKNLVDGHGLVLNPHHPPQEGYSNTLWLLLLAGGRALGLGIPALAKGLGLLSGAGAIALVHRALARDFRPAEHAVPAAVLIGAPFVVWSTSGLEHGLQATLIALVVTAPSLFPRRARWAIAAALAALVLLRPETPLLVASAALALAAGSWQETPPGDSTGARLRRVLGEVAPVLWVPAAAWVGLLVFRLAYFGDPLPNPFYAKAAEAASFLHALNPLGVAWSYVFSYLSSSFAFLLVPVLLLGRPMRESPASVRMALAMVLAQLAFVLYAQGDWMGQFRFVAPALPALALLVANGLAGIRPFIDERRNFALRVVLTGLLGVGTATALVDAVARPTTPSSLVAHIGTTFLRIGHELGVAEPTLAFHDAGGTSFEAGIDVIDLGGLGDREVAKHMRDRAFLLDYLLAQRKPTFVFGSGVSFAAGKSRFHEAEAFNRDYVRLVVAENPSVQAEISRVYSNGSGSYLSFVRRELVRETPHVHLERQGDHLARVVVRLDP